MEKWKEYEEEFPVKNIGARKVKEENQKDLHRNIRPELDPEFALKITPR